MEIFGIPLIDVEDFRELVFRFSVNFIVAFVVIRLLYYPSAKRKDYLFTYFIFNMLIFFVSFLMSSVKLQLGFAFGLFAVFGILRYRTEPLPIKEMTYLFIVISIAVINALANKKISFMELMFTNSMIMAFTFGMERVWLLRHEARKTVTYEKIDLIKPDNHHLLKEDLENRTGLQINRMEIGKIDFLRDIANIRIFYFEDEQRSTSDDDRMDD
ncbi:MAG: hypothetical protein ACI9FU_002293 [Granulosicoccus sp.]|jgi:hypothetical protein